MIDVNSIHTSDLMNTIPQNVPFQVSSSDPVEAVRGADRIVIGQLGQTLDGCIATNAGESKYINSDCGLKHLHSLRAAVDAVIVGVGSVNADDPSLTVRLCNGTPPARVIIDPKGRVDMAAGIFGDDGPEVIIITSKEIDHPAKTNCEIIGLSCIDGHIDPSAIIAALNDQGHNRILIEGGNNTLSRFMAKGILDRLHLIVAPMIMGAGLSGINLPPIDNLNEALRPEVTLFPLGRDIVFDCDLQNCGSASV